MVATGLLVAVNVIGGLVFGYNSGVVAVALGFVTTEFNLGSAMQGVFTAAILVGATFGSLFGGLYCERFGRKVCVVTVGAFGTVGALATALMPKLYLMIMARVVLGVGVGLSTVACPTYVSENAPESKKGSLGTLFQLAITFGIFISYLMELPFHHVPHNFRWMFGLGAIPGFAMLALGFLMPESPYWITKKVNEYDPLLSPKKHQIQGGGGGMADLLRPPTSRALVIGILLAVAQQLTGINAIMYYAPNILKSAHVENAIEATIGIGLWNFLTTFISTFLVDRLGRRPLLLAGTGAMAVSTLVLGFAYQFLEVGSTALSALAIILLLVFVAGFETGEGPLFWVVCTELFKPEVKGSALSFLNACTWVFNLMLTFSFLPLSDLIHEQGVFFIFGSVGTVCVGLMYFYLPETKRITVANYEESS